MLSIWCETKKARFFNRAFCFSGGERGIRTLGGSFPPHSLSRRAPSADSATSPITVRDLGKTPSFAQFLRQAQILILKILTVFLWLKFSPSLTLNKIEHFSKVSISEKPPGYLAAPAVTYPINTFWRIIKPLKHPPMMI